MSPHKTRTHYIRMDGTRRPSIFATDKAFRPKTGGRPPANAFGGYMDLPGSPDLRSIAEPAPRRSSQKNENPLLTQRVP